MPDEVSRHQAAEDEIDLSTLSWQAALEQSREETARRYLRAVMNRFEGRVADAAAHAGIERESFYRLLRRYGVRCE